MVIAKSKKVKPNMSNTIKNMDYNWTPGPEPQNNQDGGVPRAIFVPHSNSLPFEERRVTLEQPVKVMFPLICVKLSEQNDNVTCCGQEIVFKTSRQMGLEHAIENELCNVLILYCPVIRVPMSIDETWQ